MAWMESAGFLGDGQPSFGHAKRAETGAGSGIARRRGSALSCRRVHDGCQTLTANPGASRVVEQRPAACQGSLLI